MKSSLDSNATDAQIRAHKALRDLYNEVESALGSYVSPGREKALALTNLEQSFMWAGKGIYNG